MSVSHALLLLLAVTVAEAEVGSVPSLLAGRRRPPKLEAYTFRTLGRGRSMGQDSCAHAYFPSDGMGELGKPPEDMILTAMFRGHGGANYACVPLAAAANPRRRPTGTTGATRLVRTDSIADLYNLNYDRGLCRPEVEPDSALDWLDAYATVTESSSSSSSGGGGGGARDRTRLFTFTRASDNVVFFRGHESALQTPLAPENMPWARLSAAYSSSSSLNGAGGDDKSVTTDQQLLQQRRRRQQWRDDNMLIYRIYTDGGGPPVPSPCQPGATYGPVEFLALYLVYERPCASKFLPGKVSACP